MDAVMGYMHEFYFESAAMILTLITVGKMLEAHLKGKNDRCVKRTDEARPEDGDAAKRRTGDRGFNRSGKER